MKRVISETAVKEDPFFRGKRYLVSNDYGFIHTDDPEIAVDEWYQLDKKSPSYTDIYCKTKSDALYLLKSISLEFLKSRDEKYDGYYDVDWLYSMCQERIKDNCKGFLEGEYGDSIFPFCCG